MAGTKKNKNNKAAFGSGLIILLLVALVIGYYYYLSNRERQKELPVQKTTMAQELISVDLAKHYPPTVKEVLRFYSEITKCFYNEDYTQEELEQLASQARNLFDEELLARNDWSKYIMKLQEEISSYKEKSVRVSSYSLPASTDVDFFSEDGFSFARMYCTYVLVRGNAKQTIDEVFLLRKDSDGHWKIYGWDLAENVNVEE